MITIIISCVITNIMVILISSAVIYKTYKTNETKISKSIDEMKSKLDSISNALEETKYVILDLSEEVTGTQDEVDNILKDERNEFSNREEDAAI